MGAADPASLRRVPLLAELGEDDLARLAARARPVRVPAGAWLYRAGEPAGGAHLVCSGRLEVVAEGPPEVVVRVARRGAVVGEAALLLAGPRTASVRGRREAEVLELPRAAFEDLVRAHPAVALGLAHALGERLAAGPTPPEAPTPPRVLAVAAVGPGAPAAAVAARLAALLGAHGRVAVLDGGEAATERLDQAERDADRVLLVARDPDPASGWTAFCLREADHVLAVAAPAVAPAWLGPPGDALHGCELLVAGGRADPVALARLAPRRATARVSAAALLHDLGATARRLAGRSVGVVLSGGGARAFAHLGVLEELERQGVRVERFGGASLGAIVAGGAAFGWDAERRVELARRWFVERSPTRGDLGLPIASVLRGARTRFGLDLGFGDARIEELPHDFFCTSCDLMARRLVVHRTGRLSEAVYASLAIPGLFPPVRPSADRLLVDGGVLDNLPVETMAALPEGPIIAVDTSAPERLGRRRARARNGPAARRLRRLATGSEAPLPRLAETLLRTMLLAGRDTTQAARRHADLLIVPRVGHMAMLEWRRLDEALEAGRAAARAALEGADDAGLMR